MECVFAEERKKGDTPILTAALFTSNKNTVTIRFLEQVTYPDGTRGEYFFYINVPVDVFIKEMEGFIDRLKKEVTA